MADTNKLKTIVEPYVREWLQAKFGVPFTKEFLPLAGCTGEHEFDAVSADRKIVAGIKSSSGKTSGKRNPSGKYESAFAEVYFLSLVQTDRKILVLTDAEFYRLFVAKSHGKLGAGVELMYCPLPAELECAVREI